MVSLQFVDVLKLKPLFTSEDLLKRWQTRRLVLMSKSFPSTGKLIDFAFEALPVQYVVVIKNFSAQPVRASGN